ncbi:MAG: class I SAM-dependent rRNA methyltransferase [Candidatus Zixiibacteriota bacterium]
MYPILTLKPNKLTTITHHHPWIFSGALKDKPQDVPHGSLVYVAGPDGSILGTGTYSAKSMIAVRVFEFGQTAIDHGWLTRKIREANGRRAILGYGPSTDTTGYRVVFGESDNIPGLIVDRYADTIVIQLSTAGADAMRDVIVNVLVELFHPRSIIERSDLPVRREEGLKELVSVRYGEGPGEVEFREYGLRYAADIMHGQKTGFYLDQKEVRREITTLTRHHRVLNLFSYTGANGVAALNCGAELVHHVDSSETALPFCRKQAELNGLDAAKVQTECADVFQWLNTHDEPLYDTAILDPPALIKSQKDMENGRKAYHFLNRAVIRMVAHGGLLVSSSCSAFFTEDDLIMTLRKASIQAGANLHLLKTVRQAPDHPLSVYFPESAYLKTAICQVSR